MAVSELVTPPTREIGTSSQTVGVLPWTTYFDDSGEHVPELVWPVSLDTYHRMRNDPQIAGLLRGIKTPLRRMRWSIDPNGADARLVEGLADDLGLPIKGQEKRELGEPRGSFDFDYFLRHALLSLDFGFMFFELVAEPDEAEGWTHLRKVAERLPRTIGKIEVENDGGLKSITQSLGINPRPIPVASLLAVVHEKEGANWTGRSVMRALYQPWRIKDVLWRLDVMRHERAAVPTPVAKGAPDMRASAEKQMEQMAQAFKGGTASGAFIPHGADLQLLSGGKSTDILESLRYCDQQMAKALLMMFIELGQTETGSRALGDSFVDFFGDSLDSLAAGLCKVFNAHVARKYAAWNGMGGQRAPKLVAERDPNELPTAELCDLIDAGVITVDDEVEDWVRARGKLPDRTTSREDASPAAPNPADPAEEEEDALEAPAPSETAQEVGVPRRTARRAARGRLGAVVARLRQLAGQAVYDPSLLPDRNLWRDPHPWEVHVDFAGMEIRHEETLDALFAAWMTGPRAQVIDEIEEMILNADGSLTKLANMAATPRGRDIIEEAMTAVAVEGAEATVAEAAAMGRTVPTPTPEQLRALQAARAEGAEAVLARALSLAASERSMRLTGGSLTPAEVAQDVAEHLRGLKAKREQGHLSGALWEAQQSGRDKVYEDAPPERIYASELLDGNTCGPCRTVDGTEYASLEDAERDYPTGGFHACDGGPACRGSKVGVYGESEASVE